MDAALIDQTSDQFLGQWKRLVSTTNWEKGQIIHGWRESLRESGAPASEFSDESWSRRVGNVTPQHVGRLRRVFERFIDVRDEYPGLYWSHFQAALDWDDAEMWLEGAVQSDWSVADMRYQRWEATGGQGSPDPSSDGVSDGAWDEDAQEETEPGEVTSGTIEVVHNAEKPRDDDPEDEEAAFDHAQFDDGDPANDAFDDATSSEPAAALFSSLPALPPDVSEAFEAFKLCILRRRVGGWQDLSCDDLLIALDSLKQLALAPAEA
jgi:hypothetical protein